MKILTIQISQIKSTHTQATWGDGKGDGELIVTTNCLTHSSWLNQPQQPDSFSLPSPFMCLIVVNSSAYVGWIPIVSSKCSLVALSLKANEKP